MMQACPPAQVRPQPPQFAGFVAVSTHRPARALVELVKWVDQHGLELVDVQLKRPSLEDVFIELTGKSLRG